MHLLHGKMLCTLMVWFFITPFRLDVTEQKPHLKNFKPELSEVGTIVDITVVFKYDVTLDVNLEIQTTWT